MYAIYEFANGNLYSTAQSIDQVDNPLPGNLRSKLIAEPAIGSVWSTVALDFVAAAAQRKIPKSVWIQRFTIAERKEVFGFNIGSTYTVAQQKNLSALMRYLDFVESIDLDDTAIQQGVNYLETIGILAAGRAAQVLA